MSRNKNKDLKNIFHKFNNNNTSSFNVSDKYKLEYVIDDIFDTVLCIIVYRLKI